MATDSLENNSNPFGNLIKTAVGLTPLGVAGYIGFNKIRGNTALNPTIPLGVGNGNLVEVGRTVGNELKVAGGKSRKADLARIDNLTKEIMKADVLQKMFQSTEEQRVLIQSLLETMSDPSSGLSQDVLMSHKEKLLSLATSAPDSDELRESVKAVVKAIDTQGTENSKVRLAKNLREYKKLGPSLVPPSQLLTPNKGYIDLDFAGMTGKLKHAEIQDVKRRHARLVGALGDGGARRVQMVGKEVDGAFQVYAKISNGKSHAAIQPLHLGKTKSGVRAMFLNEGLTTGYAVPQQFLQAEKVKEGLTAGYKGQALTKHAGIAVEDYFLDHLVSNLKTGSTSSAYLKDPRKIGEWQRQFLTVLPREAYTYEDRSSSRHMLRQARMANNYATVVGWDTTSPEDQLKTMAQLGVTEGYEANAPGYQVLTRGLDYESIGRIGVAKDSVLSSLTGIESADRGYFPVESRIEQVFGRDPQFLASNHTNMGKNGVFTSGATSIGDNSVSRMLGKNIEWSNNLTGATNKAVLMVMDENNPIYNGLESTGAALYSGRDRVIHSGTKPVLDPKSVNGMSSKLYEHVINNYKPGEEFDVTEAMIKEHGTFLGMGGNGPQHLRNDPRTKNMRMAYDVTNHNGKQQVNFVTRTERDMETLKVFSLAHKGNLMHVDENKQLQNLAGLGFNQQQMNRFGMNLNNTVIASDDMLKKGAGFIDTQMMGAYGFITGDKNYRQNLAAASRTHGLSMLPDHQLGNRYGALVSSLASQLSAGHIEAGDVGLVLGGAWKHGERHERYQLTQTAQEAAVNSAFGSRASEVMQGIKRGVIINPTSMVQGSGVGDYGLGRGSVEPRTLQMLQQKLQNMGMSTVESAKVVASIYNRKLGGGAGLKAGQGMLQFLESVGGQQGLLSGVTELAKGIPEYGLNDLTAIGAEDFSDFLAKHKEGFHLNLGKGADSPATNAIASNARDVFGGQGRLFFPGSNTMDNLRDVTIKNTSGTDTLVHDAWTRNGQNLIRDLGAASSRTAGADEESLKILKDFRKNSVGLATETIHNVARGKIRGMQAVVGQPYHLGANISFASDKKFKLANEITKRSRGSAIFMDSTAFLSQLGDFMGSSQGDTKYVAKQLERFYHGSEMAVAQNHSRFSRGNVQIGSRHSHLSLGNVFVGQVHRELNEVGEDNIYLNKFLATSNGEGWAKKGIKNFSDVSGMSVKERSAFFNQFAEALPDFAPQGGGQAFFPMVNSSVKLTGGAKDSIAVDVGFSKAAIGDFDGDTYQMSPLDMQSSKNVLNTMRANKSEEWLRSETRYKAKSELFAEEAKAGLKKHGLGEVLDISEAAKQGLLKENSAKADVGLLNNQFDKLRTSLVDMRLNSKAGREEVDQALAMLKVVQEHVSLKGKKLPYFEPFAQRMTAAVNRIFDQGDWGSFEEALASDVFPGSNLLGDGIHMDYSPTEGQGWFSKGVESETVKLSDITGTLKQAVTHSEVTGIADATTASAIARGINSTDPAVAERMMGLLHSGNTVTAAMIRGANSDGATEAKAMLASGQETLQRVGKYMSGLDSKTTGLVVAGMVAATGLMALVGSRGYSSSPLTMPGEISGNNVEQQISAGNFLSSGKNYPQARPQVSGSTYMNGRGSYSITGTLGSEGAASQMSNYANNFSGGNMRGSISINDNRKPITQNYIDKFFGEY